MPASYRNSVLDSEQSPQKNPDRCSRTSSSDQRVEQPVGGLQAPRVGEDRPVRRRVAEELGDQDRVAVFRPGVRLTQVDRDPDHLDRGDAQLGQRPEHPVLAPGQPLAELLEGVQRAVVVDEADHVPRDAPLPDLDQPLVLPVRQRLGPRQGQQAGRVVGRGSEDEPHSNKVSRIQVREPRPVRQNLIYPERPWRVPQPSCDSSWDGAMLAPLMTTATCSPGAGL